MLFLKPLYLWVVANYATRINHFPLITLIFYSVDKTIFYLLIFLVLRWLWRRWHHQAFHLGHETLIIVFVTYLILLFSLTVFRDAYFPWQLHLYTHRPLSVINWQPLVETLKLTRAASTLDFWYQSLGNVLWFVPMGFLYPLVRRRRVSWPHILIVVLCMSMGIETLQFFFNTGVSDIDDVIFNVIGGLVGFVLHPRSKRKQQP